MKEEIIKPPVKLEITDQNQAVTVLINAARIAQAKGVYTLEEAELISRAIHMFVVQVPKQEGPISTDTVKK